MALTKIKTQSINDNAITNAKMADDAIDSADLADGSIDNVHLAGSIAVSKTLLSAGTGLTLSTNTLNVDAAQTQITSVGTIGTGTWEGTKVASAYLDDDTAHLSTNQTFSGVKTFGADYTSFNGTGYIRGDNANKLTLQMGSSGFELKNNAYNATRLTISDSGTATFAGGVQHNSDVTLKSLAKLYGAEGNGNASNRYIYYNVDYDSGTDATAGYIKFSKEDNAKRRGQIEFGVGDDGAPSTALTIEKGKTVGIGNANSSDFYYKGLSVGTGGSADTGITIYGSAWTALAFADGTSGADRYEGYVAYFHSDRTLNLGAGGVQALSLDSGRNATIAGGLGLRGTTPNATMALNVEYSTTNYIMKIQNDHATDGHGVLIKAGDDANVDSLIVQDYNASNTNFRVKGNGDAYMRGDVGIGTTTIPYRLSVYEGASDWCARLYNGATSGGNYGMIMYFDDDPNDATSKFLQLVDSNGGGRVMGDWRSNGGIGNVQSNNADLSDESVKTNIVDAPNYLDKINQMKVRNFQYKTQKDDRVLIGVIAQEVESVDSSLIDGSEDLKRVYNKDIYFMMLKSIQELSQQNDDLKKRIEALENA